VTFERVLCIITGSRPHSDVLDDAAAGVTPDVDAKGEIRFVFMGKSDSTRPRPRAIYTLRCCVLSKMKMVDKTKQSDRDPNPNEKPKICYCSALPKGSGLCLPCYTRWLAGSAKSRFQDPMPRGGS